jgi:hypothetical protein
MSVNPKDHFKSRIINLESFLTGKSNKIVKKVVDLLGPEEEDEKTIIRSIDEHWIVFLFECNGEVNGALITSKDISSHKSKQLSDIVTKYLKRVIPTTSKSTANCEVVIKSFFPEIFENNVICEIYKF